ncbi:flippase [Photobacterium damselae]
MFDEKIIKNIISLFSIRMAGYLVPLITLPFLVKTLEPTGFGLLMFSTAIIQYCIMFVNFGFDLSATQKIAQFGNDKDKVSEIFWNIIYVRIIVSIVSFFVVYVISLCVNEIYNSFSIISVLYISVLGSVFFPQWLFQGKEQLGVISIIRIVVQIMFIPLIFIFIKGSNDLKLAALFSSLPSLIVSILSFIIIKNRNWIKWKRPELNKMLLEIKDSYYLFLSNAAISLYTTSIPIILGFISGPISVAIYVSAYKLVLAAQGIYSSFSNAFYPRINNILSKDENKAKSLIKLLFKTQLTIGLSTSILLYILSPYIIILLYGNEYMASIVIMRILCTLPLIVALSNLFGVQILLTFGFKKEFFQVLILSSGVSLLVLLPLSYYFSEIGAAISVIITELLVTSLMFKTILRKNIGVF